MAARGGKKSNRQIELEEQKRLKHEERDRLAKIEAEKNASGRLQQIQEAQNEDNHLGTERANIGQGLDRCSEPGNKQGEESPSHPDVGEYQRHVSGGSGFNGVNQETNRNNEIDAYINKKDEPTQPRQNNNGPAPSGD